MEPTRNRSIGSRFARLAAVLFFSALLFGAIAGSASATKITINNPGKDNVMTPVTGMIVESDLTETSIAVDVTITAHVNDQKSASGTTASSIVAFNDLPAGAVHIEGVPASIAANDLVDMDNELRILSAKTMLFDDALRQICNAVR
jgi:hypothetical protein